MSPALINELITAMGNSLLRKIMSNITLNNPTWFSIIADEATDIVNREQLNLSVQWVNNDCCQYARCKKWGCHANKKR